jgi:predicted nucleic-acid-binding protein
VIGLDANVLLRYFVQDDPVQSPLASDLIEQRLNEDEPGFVSVVAMAETVWVLQRVYKLSAGDIAAVVKRILQTLALAVEHEQEVFLAMIALRDGQAEFADALIGALGAAAGCSHTVTFDRKAMRLPDFAAL